MEAPDCTAMCRKEAAGWTTIPASLAVAAKVGSWKRSVISWMDWSPSMDPPGGRGSSSRQRAGRCPPGPPCCTSRTRPQAATGCRWQLPQGRAAGVTEVGVCAEDGEDGRVAAGGQAGRAVDYAPTSPLAARASITGMAASFAGGLVVQSRDGVVGHAVSDDENVLHGVSFQGWVGFLGGASGGPRNAFQSFFSPGG